MPSDKVVTLAAAASSHQHVNQVSVPVWVQPGSGSGPGPWVIQPGPEPGPPGSTQLTTILQQLTAVLQNMQLPQPWSAGQKPHPSGASTAAVMLPAGPAATAAVMLPAGPAGWPIQEPQAPGKAVAMRPSSSEASTEEYDVQQCPVGDTGGAAARPTARVALVQLSGEGAGRPAMLSAKASPTLQQPLSPMSAPGWGYEARPAGLSTSTLASLPHAAPSAEASERVSSSSQHLVDSSGMGSLSRAAAAPAATANQYLHWQQPDEAKAGAGAGLQLHVHDSLMAGRGAWQVDILIPGEPGETGIQVFIGAWDG